MKENLGCGWRLKWYSTPSKLNLPLKIAFEKKSESESGKIVMKIVGNKSHFLSAICAQDTPKL